MKTSLSFLLALVVWNSATDLFFDDLHESSKSGRYHVDATSPDNAKKEGYRAFQDDFTYRCVDKSSGNIVWTRKQPKSEGSPASIMVSDSGSTVVYTQYDNLMIISPAGRVVRKIDFLKDALTEKENREYVQQTTAGPMWGLTLPYFLEHQSREYYAIRPWWGRRVIIDITNGELQQANEALNDACASSEEEIVMESLETEAKSVEDQFEQCVAIYFAGVLNIKRAIPYLRKAEECPLIGSTSGGLSWDEQFNNEVDPHAYQTFTIRQFAQLSLRRLGEKPRPLPCLSFVIGEDGESKPFHPILRNQRHENVHSVKVGMSAKEILELIGAPDFVSNDTWSYDMDAEQPFSLQIRMDARKSISMRRQEPIWLNGADRDVALVY